MHKSDGPASLRESYDSPTFNHSPNKKSLQGDIFKPTTPRVKANIFESPSRVTASQNSLSLRNTIEKPEPEAKRFGLFRSDLITEAFDQDWRVSIL